MDILLNFLSLVLYLTISYAVSLGLLNYPNIDNLLSPLGNWAEFILQLLVLPFTFFFVRLIFWTPYNWNPGSLVPSEDKILYLAKLSGEKVVIEAKNKDDKPIEIFLERNVHYIITIIPSGQIEEIPHPLQKCAVFCDLVYDEKKRNFQFSIKEIRR